MYQGDWTYEVETLSCYDAETEELINTLIVSDVMEFNDQIKVTLNDIKTVTNQTDYYPTYDHYYYFTIDTAKYNTAKNYLFKLEYYLQESDYIYGYGSISTREFTINSNNPELDTPSDIYPGEKITSPFMASVNTDYGSSYYLACYSNEALTQQVGNAEPLNISSGTSYTFNDVSLTNVSWQQKGQSPLGLQAGGHEYYYLYGNITLKKDDTNTYYFAIYNSSIEQPGYELFSAKVENGAIVFTHAIAANSFRTTNLYVTTDSAPYDSSRKFFIKHNGVTFTQDEISADSTYYNCNFSNYVRWNLTASYFGSYTDIENYYQYIIEGVLEVPDIDKYYEFEAGFTSYYKNNFTLTFDSDSGISISGNNAYLTRPTPPVTMIKTEFYYKVAVAVSQINSAEVSFYRPPCYSAQISNAKCSSTLTANDTVNLSYVGYPIESSSCCTKVGYYENGDPVYQFYISGTIEHPEDDTNTVEVTVRILGGYGGDDYYYFSFTLGSDMTDIAPPVESDNVIDGSGSETYTGTFNGATYGGAYATSYEGFITKAELYFDIGSGDGQSNTVTINNSAYNESLTNQTLSFNAVYNNKTGDHFNITLSNVDFTFSEQYMYDSTNRVCFNMSGNYTSDAWVSYPLYARLYINGSSSPVTTYRVCYIIPH